MFQYNENGVRVSEKIYESFRERGNKGIQWLSIYIGYLSWFKNKGVNYKRPSPAAEKVIKNLYGLISYTSSTLKDAKDIVKHLKSRFKFKIFKRSKYIVRLYIIGRGGSKRLPLENISKIGRHSLVYWVSKAALNSDFDDVVISTENRKLLMKLKAGVQRLFWRPKNLCKDFSNI